jgi:hypothetical protein
MEPSYCNNMYDCRSQEKGTDPAPKPKPSEQVLRPAAAAPLETRDEDEFDAPTLPLDEDQPAAKQQQKVPVLTTTQSTSKPADEDDSDMKTVMLPTPSAPPSVPPSVPAVLEDKKPAAGQPQKPPSTSISSKLSPLPSPVKKQVASTPSRAPTKKVQQKRKTTPLSTREGLVVLKKKGAVTGAETKAGSGDKEVDSSPAPAVSNKGGEKTKEEEQQLVKNSTSIANSTQQKDTALSVPPSSQSEILH